MPFKEVSGPDATGVDYLHFMFGLNLHLSPRSYFEIGTESGRSLEQFKCDAVCVDPFFKIEKDVIGSRELLLLFQMSSDRFFARYTLKNLLGTEPDVCFLDGMHRFEYLLRDFINTERSSKANSVVLVHDCLPSTLRMALRTHENGDESEGPHRYAWTGDVWKLIPILKQYRPDLSVRFLDCPPSGLLVITGLDAKSTILSDGYLNIVSETLGLSLEEYGFSKLWTAYPMLDSRVLLERPDLLSQFFPIF